MCALTWANGVHCPGAVLEWAFVTVYLPSVLSTLALGSTSSATNPSGTRIGRDHFGCLGILDKLGCHICCVIWQCGVGTACCGVLMVIDTIFCSHGSNKCGDNVCESCCASNPRATANKCADNDSCTSCLHCCGYMCCGQSIAAKQTETVRQRHGDEAARRHQLASTREMMEEIDKCDSCSWSSVFGTIIIIVAFMGPVFGLVSSVIQLAGHGRQDPGASVWEGMHQDSGDNQSVLVLIFALTASAGDCNMAGEGHAWLLVSYMSAFAIACGTFGLHLLLAEHGYAVPTPDKISTTQVSLAPSVQSMQASREEAKQPLLL